MSVWVRSMVLGLLLFVTACNNNHSEREETKEHAAVKLAMPASPSEASVMLGNLGGADIKIYELDSDGLKKLLFQERSSQGDELSEIGKFNSHASELGDSEYYLYEVEGGEDWDYDDDGIKDDTPTENRGRFYALLRGATIKSLGENFTISYMSDLLYRAVKYHIGSDDFEEIYMNTIRQMLDSSETENESNDTVVEKFFSYVPSKRNLILNENIFDDATIKSIVASIVEGNVSKVDDDDFRSVEITNDLSTIAKGTIVDIAIDIASRTILNDLIVQYYLVNETSGEKRSLDGYTIPEIGIGEHRYPSRSIIPSDIETGMYHIEVVLNSDSNFSKKTQSFRVKESAGAEIEGFAFDDDSDIDSRAINADVKHIEMSYDEGNITINSTLLIRNSFSDKNLSDIVLDGYIDIDGMPVTVPFEAVVFQNEKDRQALLRYSNKIVIPNIEPDTTLHLSSNMLITRETLLSLMQRLAGLLVGNSRAVLDADIVFRLSDGKSGELIDTYRVPVNFFMSDRLLELLSDNISKLMDGTMSLEELLGMLEKNYGKRALERRGGSPDSFDKVKFEKSFVRKKYGNKMGAGIDSEGVAWIDRDGIHTDTDTTVKVKVLKKKHYKILDVAFDVDVDPGSFEDTGYGLVIKSFGKNIFAIGESLSDVSGLSTPEVTDEDTKRRKVKKSVKYAKAKKLLSSGSAHTLIGYQYENTFGEDISKTQTIILGLIPVSVEVGAEGDIGYVADIHLEGIASAVASFTPKAAIGSWIDGGVGVGFDFFGLDVDFSAGVGGEFWLLSDDFVNKVTASIDLVPSENGEYIEYLVGSLHENITNYFKGPNGRLYLYAKWFGPKDKSEFYNPLKWDEHKRTRNLAKWSTTAYTTTLLDKGQELFRIDLIPDMGVKYPDRESPSLPPKQKNILFAHGMGSSKSSWNSFADYASEKGWNVYRTNVEPYGSIQERAKELAEYINSLDLKDDSLIAVGHSMGGLDLRYIVSHAYLSGEEPFASAAKKITKIYTIATPHKGAIYDFSAQKGSAIADLSASSMKEFNDKYPYTTLKVADRTVPLLAIRALCDTAAAFGTDGVVDIDSQALDGAYYSYIPFIARHNESTPLCSDSTPEESEMTEILGKILNNGTAGNNANQFITSHRDIVFYSENNCEGEEVGKFNSNYAVDIDCSESLECINNKASSVLLYPNVLKGTIIRVYDHPEKKTSTKNYMTIYRGEQEWDAPVCISGFQHSTSAKEESYGITTNYHKLDSDKGLNSEVSHIRIWNKESSRSKRTR